MYKVVLAFRYMFKRRISYIAFASVSLCVFIVVVVMTIMAGLVSDFRDKNHSFVGDCVVGTDSLVGFPYYENFLDILEKQDFIQATSPVVKSYALFSPGWTEQNYGFEVMGVQPAKHAKVTGFAESLHYRKSDVSKAFEPLYSPELDGCIFGVEILMNRDVNGHYSYNSAPSHSAWTVSFVPLTAKGAPAKAGAGEISSKTFYTSDYSNSGLARIDNSLVYLPFDKVQSLTGMAGEEKRVSAIHIKFKPKINLQNACQKVSLLWADFTKQKSGAKNAALLDNVTVQSWKIHRRSFIAAMEKEQMMMTVLFALMGITTVFIILVIFYMIINHKSKDIGILKSIGVSNANIIQLFLGFSAVVAFLGSAVGLFAGWAFLTKINDIENWMFERFGFQLWDRTIYAIGSIPNRMAVHVVVLIVVSAFFVCLAGAALPSWLASRQKPVETLQVSQL